MGLKPSSRLARRAAIGAGTLALTFAAAAPAGAALGTAKPGVGDRKPNLVSVTVNGSQAVYRFDRGLESGVALTATDFTLTSNAQGSIPGQSATVNGSAVRVGFGTDQDLTKYTAGSVAAFAVVTDNQTGNDFRNFPDSAPVTTTDSQDGTRGVSAAPELVEVRREGLNGLVYVFDRELSNFTTTTADYQVANAGAGETAATVIDVGAEANEVRATFAPGILDNAVSAFVRPAAVRSATAASVAANRDNRVSRVSLPGRDGVTSRADLLSAELISSSFGFGQGTVVRYTFDQAATSAADPTAFQVTLADGSFLTGDSATVNPDNPKVVDVSFTAPAADLGVQEYAVRATVGNGAFTISGQPAGSSVARADADLGGNEGASAAGWTVAPEVLGVAKTDSNELRVTIDTRLTGAPGPIVLLDTAGNPIGNPLLTSAPSSAFQGQPGPKTIIYDVPGGAQALAGAVSVYFPAGTFAGKLGASLDQLVGF
ncbi:hypothetical protein SK069_08565 [Patulibacter brassicae]|jgi:hypothetical protein|uniref:Uncharacterized protein n=1 Tax=Patulibacter brassicae TaxID=1705717 RepID=A0ABU4VIH5_9ACTN|nr:hypothetical protein [Patulibacter brassicae]MDX8151641.1 hypothetical protein [Patulibacter brassicae]